jgi:hypothetical protein
MIEVDAIVKALKSYRFNFQNEKDLQEGISEAFMAHDILFEREKELGGKYGIVDFLVDGRIGVEIKIQGGPSSVARQLLRYFECEKISELVLVTGKAKLGNLPKILLGKRLTVVSLWGTFL